MTRHTFAAAKSEADQRRATVNEITVEMSFKILATGFANNKE
jgi:hypothetical protein